MAKGSGGTRNNTPIRTRLRDSDGEYGEYGEEVTIYGGAKSIKYDELYQRFTPVVDKRGLSVLSVDDDEIGLPDTNSKETLVSWYNDFKDNRNLGYNVEDDTYTFITTAGKFYYVHGNDDALPKIKMKDVIFIEHQGASDHTVWYDNKAAGYKEKIKKYNGWTLL